MTLFGMPCEVGADEYLQSWAKREEGWSARIVKKKLEELSERYGLGATVKNIASYEMLEDTVAGEDLSRVLEAGLRLYGITLRDRVELYYMALDWKTKGKRGAGVERERLCKKYVLHELRHKQQYERAREIGGEKAVDELDEWYEGHEYDNILERDAEAFSAGDEWSLDEVLKAVIPRFFLSVKQL